MTAHDLRVLASSHLMRVFGWRVHDFVQTLHFCGVTGLVKGIRRVRRYAGEAMDPEAVELAVCAIMKNEGPYLREWIEFHRIVGVQRFYLYDNGCTDETGEVLKPYVADGTVVLIPFPGDKMQIPAYEDCIERFHNAAKWIAFIDLDEFMVPCKGDSVVSELRDLPPNCDQVMLNWLIFGSNGQERKSSEPVIKRFTRRGEKHWLEKSIVNPRRVYKMDVHWHFVAGRTIRLPVDTLRIHHYHCKSWEEYSKKSARGDAVFGQLAGGKYCRECFEHHNLNDVEDLSAMRFWDKLESRLQ